MSLILDALRKSEAERRRGQNPGLFADTVPPLAPVRSHRSAGIVLVIVLVLLLVAVFYWPRPDPSPLPAIQAGVATDIESSGKAGPAAELSPMPAAKPAPMPLSQASQQPSPAIAESAAIAPAPVIAATSASAKVIAKSPPPASSPTPASALSSAADADGLMPPPAQDSIAPIAILGASERAALPPMKLSMHVWNSDASKRFAIIDGQRIAEGSLLGSSVVEEIRRDGVVLNINGRRVLLSRP